MKENMYFRYRYRASKNNRALRNRANAAEILGISESSLSNYETGKTKCVPAEMVDQMAALYNAPELRNMYCVLMCPIGSHKKMAFSEETIEKVAVHLANSANSKRLKDSLRKFIALAAKGDIGSGRELLQEVADNFNELSFALSEFSILAERQGVDTWI